MRKGQTTTGRKFVFFNAEALSIQELFAALLTPASSAPFFKRLHSIFVESKAAIKDAKRLRKEVVFSFFYGVTIFNIMLKSAEVYNFVLKGAFPVQMYFPFQNTG